MSDDDCPPLDDFQQDIKTVSFTHKPQGKASEQDYTKPNVRHLEDEEKQKEELKEVEKKVEKMSVQVESTKKKESFGGFKKGFFSSNPKEKKEQITEVKVTKKQNPLQIKEVQQAMKMNNYLEQNKKEWMTNDFLTGVQKNNKVQKLFTNPEYMKAIQEFQTNPKAAMAKYGNNKEVMEGLMEFSMMMGNQFQNLSQKQKK